jgi:hypothetical protein
MPSVLPRSSLPAKRDFAFSTSGDISAASLIADSDWT